MSRELKVYLILLILILPFLGSYIAVIVLSTLTNNVFKAEILFGDALFQIVDSFEFLFIFLAIPILTWLLYLIEKGHIKDEYYMLIPLLMTLSGFAAIYLRIIYLNKKIIRFIVESNFEQRIDVHDIHSIRFMIIGILICFIIIIAIIEFKNNKKRTHNSQYTS